MIFFKEIEISRRICALFLLASTLLPVGAKDIVHSFSGYVIDNFTEERITGVHLMLMNNKGEVISSDSSLCFTKDELSHIPELTYNIGEFRLSVPGKGKYLLKVEKDGYDKDSMFVKFSSNRFSDVRLPPIRLNKIHEKTLPEVKVAATKVKMFIDGDTIVYNADAFNLADGSMLDGLIRMLPGVRLEGNGLITVNGRPVESLYINGRDFFNGNPKAALESLPAYTVKKIKVYTQEGSLSRLMGKNMGDSLLTMDVRLKKEYENGYSADIGAGIGSGSGTRYQGDGLIMRFNGKGNAFLYGKTNNLNDESRTDGSGNWTNDVPQSGVQKPRMVEFTRNLSLGNKYSSLSFNGYLQDKATYLETKTNSLIFLPNNNLYRTNNGCQDSRNKKINITEAMKYEGKKLFLNQKLLMEYGNSDTDGRITQNSTTNGINFNRNTRYFDDKRKALKITLSSDGGIKLWEDCIRYGLTLSFSNDKHDNALQMISNKGEYYNLYSNNTQQDTKTFYNINITGRVSGEYKVRSLVFNPSLSYSYSYSKEDNKFNRLALTDTTNLTSILPSKVDYLAAVDKSQNNYVYRTKENNITIGVEIRQDLKVFGYSGAFVLQCPLDWKYRRLHAFRMYEQNVVRRKCFFNPSAYVFMSSMSGDGARKDISLGISLSHSLPNLNYMLDFRDDTTPLTVMTGNPNLKNQKTLFSNIGFHHRWANGNALSLKGNAYWLNNMTAIMYNYNAKTDVMTYKPSSVNGNCSASFEAAYDLSLDKKQKFVLKNEVNYNYYRNIDLYSTSDNEVESKNMIHHHVSGITTNLNFRANDKYSLSASIGYTNDICHSCKTGFSDISTHNIKASINAILTLPLNLQLSTDMTMYVRRGWQQSEMNKTDWVWNAQMTRSFLKGKILAKFKCFDILHELSTTQYVVNEQGRSESWHNSIPRYFMFSVAWRFSHKPQKK